MKSAICFEIMIPNTPRMKRYARSLISVVCALAFNSAFADIKLPKILASGMVLQRNSQVNLWGWADPGESLTIQGDWLKRDYKAVADSFGNWSVAIPTKEAGSAHSITLSGKNTIQLTDILFGEVWIGSGQSNMEMPMAAVSNAYTGISNSDTEIANASFPDIRLFHVGNYSSKVPLDDVEEGIVMYGVPVSDCAWKPCTPETVPHFSSTAYFFAAELHRQLGVPIGIIDASWGGTSAEAWTPISGLEKLNYEKEVDEATQLPQESDRKIPTRLYNGMIHPLRNYTVKGVIWYQGESNRLRPEKYHDLFSTMISEWRSAFGHTFPFYFAQIAPFNYGEANAAFLREAQAQTESVPKTGMVVTMDIGNEKDIHPKNKREVGRRFALLALTHDYRKNIVSSGPRLKKSRFNKTRAHLTFEYAKDGLITKDGKTPDFFEIAGPDKIFRPATATIDGNTLSVSSPSVQNPQAVRFAFSSLASPNLTNTAGLPAQPFRTDDW